MLSLSGSRLRSDFSVTLGALVMCLLVAFGVDSRAASPAEPKTILFIGDSITAGYGVKKEEAFPDRVGEVLREKGHAVKIINGGISGSVSAESDRRLKWFLRAKPDVLVLALGGNDGLKGTPPKVIKANLQKTIQLAKKNNVRVILCGIKVYSNFGPEYSGEFEKMFKDLANEENVQFIPFLLEGVALKRELNQSDMKHPNAKGHVLVGDLVVKEVEKAL